MPASLDIPQLLADLRSLLRRRGPSKAVELCATLLVSQPTFSRLIQKLGDEVLMVGHARATSYALRRSIDGVTTPIPLFEIGRAGERTRHVAELHPFEPHGFYVEGRSDDVPSGWFDDLPWFLNDLRPSGYLGRLLPRLHPELGLPSDIRLWSSDHVLRYLTRYGWNGVGAFVVGNDAYQGFVTYARGRPADAVPAALREKRYPDFARDVLTRGPVGSSAAGEHPKFLATRDDGDRLVPVLVKFSPTGDDPVATRRKDLLVAEHLALEVIAAHAVPAARSSILEAAGRVFLEVERFDREDHPHRVGQIGLDAVDAELVGSLGTWTETTAALLKLGRITEEDHRRARWLQCFGALTANTDMHLANLSLRLRGARLDGLAPAYDASPALYQPVAAELVERRFAPPIPGPEQADIAEDVWAAAVELWDAVAADAPISAEFRAIASENLETVRGLGDALRWLPQ